MNFQEGHTDFIDRVEREELVVRQLRRDIARLVDADDMRDHESVARILERMVDTLMTELHHSSDEAITIISKMTLRQWSVKTLGRLSVITSTNNTA